MKIGLVSIAASLIGAALLLAPTLQAQITYPANTTYYISNAGCSDANAGTSSSAPWCTFNNVNGNTFSPGDQILLAAGSTWNQELDLLGTGTSSSWITLSSYGSGVNPIINRNDTTSGTLRCVRLTNPDYWNIENLTVKNAGAGILVEFTTANHNGLNISGIYATGMAPIQDISNQSAGAADGILESAGIVLTGPKGNNLSLSPGQYTINNLTMSLIEGTGNYATIVLTPPGGNGATTWGIWNGVLQNIYAHQDVWPQNGSLYLTGTNNSTLMDSVATDILNGLSTGTIDVLVGLNNNLVTLNSMFTDVPDTNSPDGGGWDNEAKDNGAQFYGNYFANNAGGGIELLTIHGSGDFDTSNTIMSNLFVNNGGGSSNGSAGAVANAGNFNPTGTASQNIYYEGNYPFNVLFGGGSGNWNNFTFTNNVPADSGLDTWNAMNGFSGSQGQDQWSYQYFNGSSWANMGTYNAYASGAGISGIWSSWGADNNTALVWGNMMLPDACNTCWTSRTWTAPYSGNVSIRGWVTKTHSGGNGVLVNITQNGSAIWGGSGTTLAGTNTTGFSTNVDVTVSAGDIIRFQVNNGGSGNNGIDQISWSPNIIYTNQAGKVTNANFQTPTQPAKGYQYGPMTYGWTFNSNAGVQANGSAWGAPSAPEGGTQTGFLQGPGSVSQSIDFAAGTYYISFLAAQRTGAGGPQTVAVYVDSTLVGTFSSIPSTFTSLTTSSFTLTAGTHTVTIKGITSGDDTAFLDDVTITELANANFQAPAQPAKGYQYGPMTYGWTFNSGAGVQANGSAFGAPSAPNGGTQAGFLQGGSSSVIQSVAFNAGTYNISFYAAQRSSGGAQAISVYIDSTLVKSFSSISTSFTLLTTNNFTVTTGTHTITIEGLNTGDNTAFIDDVQINP
jgi:hypothetical protein